MSARITPNRPPSPSERHAPLVRAHLKPYLDGELSGPRRWMVDLHLARCRACQEELTALKRLSDELRAIDQAVPRPELRRRIMASLPERPPRSVSQPRLPLRHALASGVFGTLLLGGAAFAGYLLRAATTGVPNHAPHEMASTKPAPSAPSPPLVDQPVGPDRVDKMSQVASAPTTSSDPFAPSPELETFLKKSEYSREATRATEAWLLEQRRKQQQKLRTHSLNSRHDFGQGTDADPLRLAVAVPDPSSARSRLEELARRLHGQIASATERGDFPASVAVPDAFRNEKGASASEGPLLVVRVPTEWESDFRHALTRSDFSVVQAAHSGARPGAPRNMVNDDEQGKIYPTPSANASSSDEMHPKIAVRPRAGLRFTTPSLMLPENGKTAYRTFLIRLQPAPK